MVPSPFNALNFLELEFGLKVHCTWLVLVICKDGKSLWVRVSGIGGNCIRKKCMIGPMKALRHTHTHIYIYMSYIRHKDFRPDFVTLRPPPLDSERGWTGELWLDTKRITFFFFFTNFRFFKKNVFFEIFTWNFFLNFFFFIFKVFQ